MHITPLFLCRVQKYLRRCAVIEKVPGESRLIGVQGWSNERDALSGWMGLTLTKLCSAFENILTEPGSVGSHQIPLDGYHTFNFNLQGSHPDNSLSKGCERCPQFIRSRDCPHDFRRISHVQHP
jgi:hypothetical protein